MKTKLFLNATLLCVVLGIGNLKAEETTLEKANGSKNEAVDSVKRTYRDAKDQTCEMVNGKMKCVAKKAVNKLKNAKDNAETESEKIKDKID